MVHIPPEIKALIVDEICHSRDPESSLSALCLVWKDAVPFIRSHRFNNVHIFMKPGLSDLLALNDNPTRPLTLIRKLTVTSGEHEAKSVVLSAINVEVLTYTAWNSLKSITSLATHTSLRSLILTSGEQELSTLMDLLRSIPRLTSLTLTDFHVREFRESAARVWPYNYLPDVNAVYENNAEFFLKICAPMQWEAYNFPDSDPLPNISHLSLDVSESSHLWFLDFISSPKSPFRDLQYFSLSDITGSFMVARVDAVLQKYRSSLVMFELNKADHMVPSVRGDVFPPVRLTLPDSIQHYKFFVDTWSNLPPLHPDSCYANIKSSCTTLKHVTMHIRFSETRMTQISRINTEMDRALASLDLEKFDVQIDFCSVTDSEVEQMDGCARWFVTCVYPLVMEKFIQGDAEGRIFWAYKGEIHACA